MFKSLTSRVEDVTEKGEVTVVANAFGNVDADNQISMPGSFTKSINETFNRLKWFLNHDRTILLGIPLEAKEVANQELQVRGQLNMKKQVAMDTLEDYKLWAQYGRTLEHSVGVTPVKADPWERDKPQKVYEWKWWEYSTLTSWGANPLTPMREIKSDNPLEEMAWLETMLRKGNYTDERFKRIEQQFNILKSLVTNQEPPKSTPAYIEPATAINTIKHFLNQK